MGNTPSPLISVVLGSVFLVLVHQVSLRISSNLARQKFIKQHGCKPCAKYPHRDPFFGTDKIRDAFRAIRSRTFLDYLRNLYELNGNTYSSRLATMAVINTIEPENIKTILSTRFQDFIIGSPRRDALSPLLGNSLIVVDGAQWEHARAMLRPSFARSQIGDLSTLEVHVKNLVQAVSDHESTVDLSDLFTRYTADVTTDFMFGESIQSLLQPESFQPDLMKAFRDAAVGSGRRILFGKFARFVPQPKFFNAVKKVHAYMDAHVDRAIEYRKQQQSSHDAAKNSERYVFLHELSKITHDRQKLRDELLTIFFAGRDTTSALLSNLFFVLARNSRVWQRLRAEVHQLKGARPTLGELKAMQYLGFCLNEALRLYAVIPAITRIAVRNTFLPEGGGADAKSPIFVSAGTQVAFHLGALHQRKDLWGPDASEFRPERWEDRTAFVNFLPFGGGPRNCIGQQFAIIEASYTTIRLIQEFSAIESRDPEPWTELIIGGACTSANGVKVVMTKA